MSRRIAIVEDELAIRDNYTEVFQRQGYEVCAFAQSDRPNLTPMRVPSPRSYSATDPYAENLASGDGVRIDFSIKIPAEPGPGT